MYICTVLGYLSVAFFFFIILIEHIICTMNQSNKHLSVVCHCCHFLHTSTTFIIYLQTVFTLFLLKEATKCNVQFLKTISERRNFVQETRMWSWYLLHHRTSHVQKQCNGNFYHKISATVAQKQYNGNFYHRHLCNCSTKAVQQKLLP